MAVDLTAIRKAVAANARTADGLEDSKHYNPGATQGSPTFWVELESMERGPGFGSGNWVLGLIGRLRILGTWDRSVSGAGDRLADDVFDGIGVDKTLGGLACDSYVSRAEWDPDEDGTLTVSFFITVLV